MGPLKNAGGGAKLGKLEENNLFLGNGAGEGFCFIS